MTIKSVLSKFFHLSWIDKKILIEAVAFLYLSKLLLLLVPFKLCIKTIYKVRCPKEVNLLELTKIKTAIYRANRLAFWENMCIVQSFAVRWMLQKRSINSSFFIGFEYLVNKKISTHAWVTVNGEELTIRGNNLTVLTEF